MIKMDETEVFGFEAAVRGMRNPMNSWNLSDSYFCHDGYWLGENDLRLMRSLATAGDDHGKCLRMITVQADILAPLYWWKEFDTYKVGTVANSCSTMHKIHQKPFTRDDFSCEHLDGYSARVLADTVTALNYYRKEFVDYKNKRDWWALIQLLPTSYNQKRTVQLNYQVLRNIFQARKSHKLDEWHDFCEWVKELPFSEELIMS